MGSKTTAYCIRVSKKELIELWHETQVGHYKKCIEKQFEFSDIMWKLYNEQENITAD